MSAAEQATWQMRAKALREADYDKFRADLVASGELCNTLRDDFVEAVHAMADRGQRPTDFRNAVRCFGSLINGLTSSMREAAVMLCRVYGEPLNPFLTDKTSEAGLSTHQRIYAIYRLLANFLPKSPFARIADERWSELRTALEIRNRVMHPRRREDLDITNDEIMLIMKSVMNFYQDLMQFVQWFGRKEQKMYFDLPGTRRRYIAKVGRNEPCPCGSKLKFKNCCGLAEA